MRPTSYINLEGVARRLPSGIHIAGGSGPDIEEDIMSRELFTHNALLYKLEDMSVRETLDYALNMY